MITIQSVLLVSLGFLVACLLWLMAAPAFWNRAVRLTQQRIRESLPLTEAEIAAERDRLRAEHAVKVHRLQSELERLKLASARQSVEINRRDARVNALERDLENARTVLEEVSTARLVLEQTVADRLPRVEQRLGEAKRLLFNRDRDISELTRTAERQARALEEASAINDQLRREVATLSGALETAAARNHDGLADPRFASEVAMRAELEALRARTRDQSDLIERLQRAITDPALAAAAAPARREPARPAVAIDAEAVGMEVAALRARLRAEEEEHARTRAALTVFQQAAAGDGGALAGESRIALKASLGALETEGRQQKAQIAELTAEVSALKAELAQRANQHAAEAGRPDQRAHVVAAQPRSEAAAVPRLTLSERVARTRQEVRPGEPAPPEGGEVVVLDPAGPRAQVPPSSSPAPALDPAAKSGDERADDSAARARPRLLDRISDYSKA